MEQPKKGVPTWVWFLALVPVAFAVLGVGSALAIHEIVERAGATAAGATALRHAGTGGSPAAANWLLFGLIALCAIAGFVAGVWLLVLAFRQSVMWGVVSLFVPCGQLIFIVQHWEKTKRPALLSLGSVGGVVVAALMSYQLSGDTSGGATVASSAEPGREPAPHSGPGVKLPPPPPLAAVPELTGAPVDLSTVMGKARKLANQWEQDAALVGIEATLVAGLIQTQDAGVARLTFGPSIFESARRQTGLFVVTYDKSGLRGAAVKGPSSKTLPEPMCAPEVVYARIAGGAQPSVSLRYAFDASERPAWIGLVAGQPVTHSRQFEPERCDLMGIVVGPRRR